MASSSTSRTFFLHHSLGRGGFGEVYLATQRSTSGLESQVAVKVLGPEHSGDTLCVRRFRDEGRVLARLSHPNILTVFDLVELDGRTALVTEYVAGSDLSECLRGERSIPPRALMELVVQVASALEAAWRTAGASGPLRLVHRDLKPTNIRVGRHGQVRLLDFGIAYFVSPERESSTASDVILGSLPYMAPERFIEEQKSPGSDLFGLGCCLYEGLSGERFHLRADVGTMSALALNTERYKEHLALRVGRIQEDTDPEVLELLRSLLAHEPSRRPSLSEVIEKGEAWLETASGERLRSWCRARDWPEVKEDDGEWSGREILEGGPLVNEEQAPLKERSPVSLTRVGSGKRLRFTLNRPWFTRVWMGLRSWVFRLRWPIVASGVGCLVVALLAVGLVGLLTFAGLLGVGLLIF